MPKDGEARQHRRGPRGGVDPRDNSPYAIARRDDEQIINWKVEFSAMRRHLSEHFDTDIREMRRRYVMVAVNRIKATAKRGAAQDLYRHCYSFFGWCVEQDYIDVNPLAGARRKRAGSERLDREENGRSLSDQEIIAVIRHAYERGDSFVLLVIFFCSLERGATRERVLSGARCRAIASSFWRARPRKAGRMPS
jgi:hypothetical protein